MGQGIEVNLIDRDARERRLELGLGRKRVQDWGLGLLGLGLGLLGLETDALGLGQACGAFQLFVTLLERCLLDWVRQSLSFSKQQSVNVGPGSGVVKGFGQDVSRVLQSIDMLKTQDFGSNSFADTVEGQGIPAFGQCRVRQS